MQNKLFKNITTMTLQEIKNQLPSGAINEIAKRTGVSQPTISQVLSGKAKSKKQNEILQTTAEIITEHRTKEREAMQALQKAVQVI